VILKEHLLEKVIGHLLQVMTPKLLNGLKCGSKLKTMEEQGVEARSLVRNTLGVEGHVGAPGWD